MRDLNADTLHHIDAPLEPGEVVGAYRIDGLSAEGGFAAVYRATHTPTGKAAAIKVLHSRLLGRMSVVERFLLEADAARRVQHPGVVEVFALGALPDGRPYLAMEWVQGADLRAMLDARGPMSLEEAVAIMGQLCDALAAVHAHGVVHRDLKPHNVLLVGRDTAFTVKVVDFGVAKVIEEGAPSMTTSGTVVGTPLYMAPEQLRGERVDARADLYALGLLLYEMLTGRAAFRADSPGEVRDLHLHAPAPRPGRFAAVPPWVDDVVRRCLEKDPARRYPDAASLAADLRAGVAPPAPDRSAGLLVDVRLPVDADDDELDATEALLAAARACLEEAGAVIALETSTAIVGTLPAVDAKVRALSGSLAERLRPVVAAWPRLAVAVAAHEASAPDLARLGTWPMEQASTATWLT